MFCLSKILLIQTSNLAICLIIYFSICCMQKLQGLHKASAPILSAPILPINSARAKKFFFYLLTVLVNIKKKY